MKNSRKHCRHEVIGKIEKHENIRVSTFVSDTGYRVVPTYQDRDGTSVFYAGPINELHIGDNAHSLAH